MLIDDLRAAKKRALHFSLIDPDRQRPAEAGRIAGQCRDAGTDAIMIGGSSSIKASLLESTVAAIKSRTRLPTILFPSSAKSVTGAADHIFFMTLLNADNPRYFIREQARAAPRIARLGLDAISMGYIVVSTSRRRTSVERRAARDRIARRNIAKAVAYALAGGYLGLSCVYLEAGSGADETVPPRMVTAVKARTALPVLVGGGIRTPARAARLAAAGADVIVTGTVVEREISRLEEIIRAVRTHGAGR
jgi:phosphoglycerol geranylgeranyltransferase